jgi:hypothetical protein
VSLVSTMMADFTNLYNHLQHTKKVYNEKRRVDSELKKLKTPFVLTRKESNLYKCKHVDRLVPSEHNYYENLYPINNEQKNFDENYKLLDLNVYWYNGTQYVDDDTRIFVDKKGSYFLRDDYSDLYPFAYAREFKFVVNNELSAKKNFRRYWAARKIQRCVRDWLWRPFYRSGHVGYHARKGFENTHNI